MASLSVISRLKGKSRGLQQAVTVAYDPAAGTQEVKGAFYPNLLTTIRLDPSVFNAPGTYTIIKYGTFTTDAGKTPQQQLNTYLRIDGSLLDSVRVVNPSGTVNEALKIVTVTTV